MTGSRRISYFVIVGLLASAAALPAWADTLSSDLSSSSGGTEAATGDTWLADSFATGSSSYTLDAVTLSLANVTARQPPPNLRFTRTTVSMNRERRLAP